MMQAQRTAKLSQKLWHGADYNYEQWLDTPDILADDFRLMRLAHCNVMSVGIFSWAMLEPQEGQYEFGWLDTLMDTLAANEMMAMLATPSAAPPAWLSRKYPETRRVNDKGIREPHKGRQNFCYTSPIYREKVTAMNRQLAARYGKHPALLLWHVSNEYVGVPCHCELCYAAFHEWLKARYGDLEALNKAWWATFWSHRYSAWEEIEPIDSSVHGLMLDWQRFVSDQALQFFLVEAAPLREITPDVPVTINFMQPDVSLNYWDFVEHLDVISWDSYPRWHQGDDVEVGARTAFYHDLHRSYKRGQPFLLMESTPSLVNWQGVSRLKQPGMHKLASLQAVAHGANSVQYFQWRQSRGGAEKFHGAVVSHLNTENTRVFRDVAEVGSVLESIKDVLPTTTDAPVAIIYDYENEWALDHAQLPRSLAKNYQETCRQHHKAFWQQGVATDIIPADAELDGYRVVVAPMLYMLRPGVAERIEAFVKRGGIFITTYLAGMVNETDLCFLEGYPPALRRTLGLYSEEMDTLADQQSGTLIACEGNALQLTGTFSFHHYAELVHVEGAQVLAAYQTEFYAGYPALTMNQHGSGQAYFVAARTGEDFLTAFYARIVAQAKLALPFSLPTGVSAQVREGDGRRYVFLMNFNAEERHVDVGAGLRDTVTGADVASSLSLQPFGIAILVQEKIASVESRMS